MIHLIAGYGYCGYYLASCLLQQKQQVITLSRHLEETQRLPGVTHVLQDVLTPLPSLPADTILYYLIPPLAEGHEDALLRQFLAVNKGFKPAKAVYVGSSAVYGDHQGSWVDEQASLKLVHPRQYRRLDAETQWQAWCERAGIVSLVLRVAGIYGPGRLPVEAARLQTPVITPDEAPMTNHIYVRDLATLTTRLALTPACSGVFNMADGEPKAMGSLQQQVAKACHIPPAPYQDFATAFAQASLMKREFMQGSKRLSIKALKEALAGAWEVTAMEKAVMLISSNTVRM